MYIMIKEVDIIQHFFFHAEEGVRDVERSRGLGSVYKRQIKKGDCSVALFLFSELMIF